MITRRNAAGLAAVYLCSKGMAATFLQLAMLPLFKESYAVNSIDFQKYVLIIMLPWSIKPVVAALSDTYGMAKAIVICVSLSASIAAFAMSSQTASLHAAVGLATVCSAGIAFVDIITEGEYAHIMATCTTEQLKRRVVSLVWTLILVGQLASSILSAFLNTRILLLSVAALLTMPVLPALCGWLYTGRDTHAWLPGITLGLALTAVAIVLIPVTLYASTAVKLCYITTSAVFLIIFTFKVLPYKLAKANAYMFATSVLYLNVSGAVDYWFTAAPHCIPGGPNFDLRYYVAAGAVVSSLFATIAVGIFNSCFAGITNYRHMFWITASIRIIAASTDIVTVNRWNIAVGIPDKAMFLLGDAALQSVAATLETMPLVLLTSELATGGAESTTYALLAGFQNFGGALAASYGYILQGALEVSFDNERCDDANLAWLVGFAHMGLPFLTIPLSVCLID